MPTPPTLRHFLYRDDNLVRDFLAQLEGGVSQQERRSRRSSRSRGLSGQLGPGFARAGANVGGEAFEENELIVQQTAAGHFEQLYAALIKANALKVLDRPTTRSWQQVRRNSVIELEVEMHVAGFTKLSNLSNQIEKFVALADAFSATPDPRAAAMLRQMKMLGALDSTSVIPVIASCVAAPEYRFGCLLQASSVRVDLDGIEGEAVLVGKLQKKLIPGEEHMTMPGLTGLIRATGKSANPFSELFDAPEAANFGVVDPRVQHPGGVIVPIAIFR